MGPRDKINWSSYASKNLIMQIRITNPGPAHVVGRACRGLHSKSVLRKDPAEVPRPDLRSPGPIAQSKTGLKGVRYIEEQ